MECASGFFWDMDKHMSLVHFGERKRPYGGVGGEETGSQEGVFRVSRKSLSKKENKGPGNLGEPTWDCEKL